MHQLPRHCLQTRQVVKELLLAISPSDDIKNNQPLLEKIQFQLVILTGTAAITPLAKFRLIVRAIGHAWK